MSFENEDTAEDREADDAFINRLKHSTTQFRLRESISPTLPAEAINGAALLLMNLFGVGKIEADEGVALLQQLQRGETVSLRMTEESASAFSHHLKKCGLCVDVLGTVVSSPSSRS